MKEYRVVIEDKDNGFRYIAAQTFRTLGEAEKKVNELDNIWKNILLEDGKTTYRIECRETEPTEWGIEKTIRK